MKRYKALYCLIIVCFSFHSTMGKKVSLFQQIAPPTSLNIKESKEKRFRKGVEKTLGLALGENVQSVEIVNPSSFEKARLNYTLEGNKKGSLKLKEFLEEQTRQAIDELNKGLKQNNAIVIPLLNLWDLSVVLFTNEDTDQELQQLQLLLEFIKTLQKTDFLSSPKTAEKPSAKAITDTTPPDFQLDDPFLAEEFEPETDRSPRIKQLVTLILVVTLLTLFGFYSTEAVASILTLFGFNKMEALATEDKMVTTKLAFKEIIRALKKNVPKTKIPAEKRIEGSDAKPKDSIPALIIALKDKNQKVRRNAAEALGKMGAAAKDAVPALIIALEDDYRRVQLDVSWALSKIGEEAIPALIIALEDKNPRVRRNAAEALIQVRINTGDKNAIPALIIDLKDKNLDLRISAARGLVITIYAKQGFVALKDEDSDVRSNAVAALDEICDLAKDAVEALSIALKDKNQRMRRNAAKALGQIGISVKDAVEALSTALKDKDSDVRYNAVQALDKIRDTAKDAVPALIIALKDEDLHVRARAAEALGRIGNTAKDAVPALIIALKDKNPYVRSNAVAALGQIGISVKDAVEALSTALKDKDLYVRARAAEALGKMGAAAKDTVPALIIALKDKNQKVRRNAAKALGKMGAAAKDAVPALIIALKDKNQRMRRNAALALRRIGNAAKDAVPALIIALEDEDLGVRLNAAEALGEIGAEAKDAVPELIIIDLKEKYEFFAFKWALKKISPKGAEAALLLHNFLKEDEKEGDLEALTSLLLDQVQYNEDFKRWIAFKLEWIAQRKTGTQKKKMDRLANKFKKEALRTFYNSSGYFDPQLSLRDSMDLVQQSVHLGNKGTLVMILRQLAFEQSVQQSKYALPALSHLIESGMFIPVKGKTRLGLYLKRDPQTKELIAQTLALPEDFIGEIDDTEKRLELFRISKESTFEESLTLFLDHTGIFDTLTWIAEGPDSKLNLKKIANKLNKSEKGKQLLLALLLLDEPFWMRQAPQVSFKWALIRELKKQDPVWVSRYVLYSMNSFQSTRYYDVLYSKDHDHLLKLLQTLLPKGKKETEPAVTKMWWHFLEKGKPLVKEKYLPYVLKGLGPGFFINILKQSLTTKELQDIQGYLSFFQLESFLEWSENPELIASLPPAARLVWFSAMNQAVTDLSQLKASMSKEAEWKNHARKMTRFLKTSLKDPVVQPMVVDYLFQIGTPKAIKVIEEGIKYLPEKKRPEVLKKVKEAKSKLGAWLVPDLDNLEKEQAQSNINTAL